MDYKSNSFWEVTYRQNIARLVGVCYRYTQNRETAEDLAHDAFLVAIDKVSSFENKGPFEAWLRRIVVNVALQYLREQKKQQRFEVAAPQHDTFDNIQQENPDNENTAISETELLEVIGHLPEHHRLVFNLYVVDTFTHAQIAAQLGISEGTSKSHLARARKKIKELLSQRIKKDEKRKRAFFWLLHIWNADLLVNRKLNQLSIPPVKKLHPENIAPNGLPFPQYKPFGISKIYLKSFITSVVILAGISNWFVNYNQENNSRKIIMKPDQKTGNSSVSNSKKDTSNQLIFSDPISATNSQNPIIVENSKNVEPMKNLKTLGGLLLTGIALDTTGLTLPVPFKKQEIVMNRIEAPAVSESGQRDEPKSNPLSGTFYASKLFWSEVNNKLYIMGDHVKVNLNRNKFNGSGKFSFIKKFGYLVVNGSPVKLNETVHLENKKYELTELTESEGIKKYGDKGKLGVVEITLAE